MRSVTRSQLGRPPHIATVGRRSALDACSRSGKIVKHDDLLHTGNLFGCAIVDIGYFAAEHRTLGESGEFHPGDIASIPFLTFANSRC
jgi:hypothetical protein